jgi:hypothetical protein
LQAGVQVAPGRHLHAEPHLHAGPQAQASPRLLVVSLVVADFDPRSLAEDVI